MAEAAVTAVSGTANAPTGVVIVLAITALLLGVSCWAPLAVATTTLAVVPFVGAIVSGVLVVATTFVTAGQTQGIIALVVFVAYQQIEETVLQPLAQRRTIELHPAVVLGPVLLGTVAAGIFGGVLALPLAAAAKVLAADALERRRARWRRARSRSAVAPTDEPRLVERPPPH